MTRSDSSSRGRRPTVSRPPKKWSKHHMQSPESSAHLVPTNDEGQTEQIDSDLRRMQLVQPSGGGAGSALSPTPAPGSPTSRLKKIPSDVTASSPSRIHGNTLRTGKSEWLELAEERAILVDKSLAIRRIMENGSDIMAAIAPRCTGKMTFLTLMAEFLSAHSTWSADDRERLLKDYDLYTQHPDFFKGHFAKYPVFYLGLSVSITTCFVDVSSIISVEYLRRLLRAYTGSGSTGRYASIAEMKSAIKGIAKRHAELLSNMATPITDMCLFLPDLSSVLYMCPNGQKAVVIIDEYDTPLVHILSEEGVDKQECSKVVGVYSRLYLSLFK
ncbi:hypothetical protein GGI13_003992, partial [Coemansia sp. RSA 455]